MGRFGKSINKDVKTASLYKLAVFLDVKKKNST